LRAGKFVPMLDIIYCYGIEEYHEEFE
jgi:hypothetical protein